MSSSEVEITRRGDWLVTYTGRSFYPYDPKVGDIDPVDIAQGLSLTNRFTGQTKWPYSVAQHCCLMSQYVYNTTKSRLLALKALLHDAAEAYICDLPRPLKKDLPEYKAVEDKILEIIAYRFSLIQIIVPEIKAADTEMLVTEAKYLCNGPEWWKANKYPYPVEGLEIIEWSWTRARDEWLERLEELTHENIL